jgi:hypothetical protein
MEQRSNLDVASMVAQMETIEEESAFRMGKIAILIINLLHSEIPTTTANFCN